MDTSERQVFRCPKPWLWSSDRCAPNVHRGAGESAMYLRRRNEKPYGKPCTVRTVYPWRYRQDYFPIILSSIIDQFAS